MNERPKTGMRERARRKDALEAVKATKREAMNEWLRERRAALAERTVKAKRRQARVRKSAFGKGRVPARYRVEKPAPVVLVEPTLGTYKGMSGNRAQRRAAGQRGAKR